MPREIFQGVLPPLAVLLFNEWIFLRAFFTWMLGEYDVRWVQERTERAAPHRGHDVQ